MAWLPGWESAQSAHTWAHFWFWFGMWCFLWLGVSEVIAFMYDLRKDHLVEATQTTAATQAQQQQDNLQRQLNDAEANRKSEVDALQKQLTEAGEKLRAVQANQADRTITTEQRECLIKTLTPFKDQKFSLVVNAGEEPGQFGNQFLQIFNLLQWKNLNGGLLRAMASDLTGLHIAINQAEGQAGRIPPAVVALVETLVELGLKPDKVVEGKVDLPPDAIYLRIGRKPPPS
jgi:hypothetical protein